MLTKTRRFLVSVFPHASRRAAFGVLPLPWGTSVGGKQHKQYASGIGPKETLSRSSECPGSTTAS